MKNILKYLLIGLVVGGIVGLTFATFLIEVVFTGTSKDVASIFAWAIYLCCVNTVCTGIIVSKLGKTPEQ